MRITKNPEERRKEIISVARELFEEQGVINTKIRDIVKKIGVSQGLFYYYFKSKDEVVTAVMEQIIEETDAEGAAILQDKSTNFYQKTLQYLKFYDKVMNRLERFLGGPKRADGILSADIIKKAEDQMVQQMKQLIKIGVEEGTLKLKYPEEMVMVLFYGLTGIRLHRLPSEQYDPDMDLTIIEQVLSIPSESLKEADGE